METGYGMIVFTSETISEVYMMDYYVLCGQVRQGARVILLSGNKKKKKTEK